MGTWWQILLSSAGAVLAAFIAGAYSVRNARKQPFEVLQALLKVTEDHGSVLTPVDRAVLENAVHREVQRIDRLNQARTHGFWAYQRERWRLTLALPQRDRSTATGVLLLVAGVAIVVLQLAAGRWWETFAEGGLSQALRTDRLGLAMLLASIGVALWLSARAVLPVVRALLRWIHVLPTYMVVTAVTVMVYVPATSFLSSYRPTLVLLVAIPLIIGVAMWFWLRLELAVLMRHRDRRFARRRLCTRLRRRRSAVTTTSATLTLLSLSLVAVFMGMGVSDAMTQEDEFPVYGVLEWNGYQAGVDSESQWISEVEPLPGAAPVAPATLVYAVRYQLRDPAKSQAYRTDVRFLTTAAELRVDERGLYHVQVASRGDHHAVGFMICESPRPGAACSPWQRL
ncbi:hypothetical protein [Nocardia sp. NPDC048505]|uniref:hypothetical protein n=1 Tax=unclassified Nocardia TaxID=2637762 RepID=UPI0033E46F1F